MTLDKFQNELLKEIEADSNKYLVLYSRTEIVNPYYISIGKVVHINDNRELLLTDGRYIPTYLHNMFICNQSELNKIKRKTKIFNLIDCL